MNIKSAVNYILVKYFSFKYNLLITDAIGISYKSIKKCGDNCRVLGPVHLSGNIQINRYTSINGPGTRISSKINPIKVGSFCSIASNVIIQEYYHRYDRMTSYFINQNIFNLDMKEDIYSKGSIVIEDDVWIGSNSVILSGVKIGRGSIVGAGSVVTKDVVKYSIVAGNPAKLIKMRFGNNTISYLEKLKWWTWRLDKIKKSKDLFNKKLHW